LPANPKSSGNFLPRRSLQAPKKRDNTNGIACVATLLYWWKSDTTTYSREQKEIFALILVFTLYILSLAPLYSTNLRVKVGICIPYLNISLPKKKVVLRDPGALDQLHHCNPVNLVLMSAKNACTKHITDREFLVLVCID